MQELSGAITSMSGSGAPGSYLHLTGFAIPSDSGPGSIRIGGLDAPVWNVTPTSMDVQIPWELTLPGLERIPDSRHF